MMPSGPSKKQKQIHLEEFIFISGLKDWLKEKNPFLKLINSKTTTKWKEISWNHQETMYHKQEPEEMAAKPEQQRHQTLELPDTK